MTHSRVVQIGWLVLAIVGTIPLVARADSAGWSVDADGDWSNANNWTVDGPPNGAGQSANFNFDLSVSRFITLDTDQTVGILNVSDPTSGYFDYTLVGTGKLIFNNSGNGAQINKTQNVSIIDLLGADPNNGLNPNTAQDVFAVPIELQENLTIRNNAITNGGALLFSEPISNNGSNRNVTVRGPQLGSPTPGNQGGKALVIFSAENSYGGTTTINNGGRLRITHGGALGTGAVASISGGGSGNSVSMLELSGGITVNNNVTAIGGADASLNTVARIASVSGHNTYAGSILNVTTGGGNYPIHSVGTESGDFFTFSGDIINNRNAVDNRTIRLGGAGDGEVTGEIRQTSASTWSLIKEHAGTWTLSGDNTYTGTTAVSAGTLLVNGMHNGGAGYTVDLSGRLGGSGSISADVSVTGTISPGSSLGTLTVGGLTINDSATGFFDLDPADPDSDDDDLINVTGTGAVNLNASILNIVVSSAELGGAAFSNPGSWLLIDGETLSGVLPSTINFTFVEGLAGVTPSLDFVNGNISLVLTSGGVGDFNGDGFVDAADYVAWRKGFGTIYDQEDYDDWRSNFGNSNAAIGTGLEVIGVPEPASLVLLLTMSIGLLSLRRVRDMD